MTMLLTFHVNPLPPELLDRDKCFVDMFVLGDKVGSKVERETLRVENVRRSLRKV